MKLQKKRLSAAITFALTLTIAATFITALPIAFGLEARETRAFISVNPPLLGLGQPLTVNGWVHPQPTNSTFHTAIFTGLSVVFTKPDGTTETIGPFDSEQSGTFWLSYVPDKVGNWGVKLVYPAGKVGNQDYLASTSPTTAFVVQNDLVQIGLPPVQLPTGYWERPVNSDNREWSQISGPWLAFGDTGDPHFNRYSTAPETSHILWKQEVSAGGIFGGDMGIISAVGTGGTPAVIFMGKLYVNNVPGTGTGTRFSAIDLRSGKVLWTAAGSVNFGSYRVVHGQAGRPGAITSFSETPTPILWGTTSSAWTMYNAFTGAVILTITGIPPSSSQEQLDPFFYLDDEGDDFIVYVLQQSGTYYEGLPYVAPKNQMLMLNLSLSGSTFASKIVWNVTLPNDIAGSTAAIGNGIDVEDGIGIVSGSNSRHVYGWDMTTGKRLWDFYVDYTLANTALIYEGKWVTFDLVEMTWKAYDLGTGRYLWTSPPMDYPWGAQASIKGADDNFIYVYGYDGTLRAIDPATGKFAWTFFTGNNTETPYGTWAPYRALAAADGKVYFGTSEHTPTAPQMRGNKLFAVDAETGQGIWNISGAIAAQAISEGYLIGTSENDGYQYVFGKGKTATAVSVSQSPVVNGSSTVIQGTVLDQSPAQPGTPAVSSGSMTAWMEYLHMQKPQPTSTIGVPVQLRAMRSDGSIIEIGEVTTDMGGHFSFMWTPPDADCVYTITASFAGDGSYWSSWGETALGVTAASPPSATQTPEAAPDNTVLFTGIMAAIVVVAILVAINIVLQIRKQRK